MALLGGIVDRKNPPEVEGTHEYTLKDFLFWMPAFKLVKDEELQTMFKSLFPIAYKKIFYSIFGVDWYFAISLCIAHYNYLIQKSIPNNIDPETSRKVSLSEINGGGVFQGILSSAGIGGFNKSFDLSYTNLSTEEALFWNGSSYGAQLLALYKSKARLTAFVVTDGPLVPGTAPFAKYPGAGRSGQAWVDEMINPKKFLP